MKNLQLKKKMFSGCFRLTEGLKTLGEAEAIKMHSEVMKQLFLGGSMPLEVEDLLTLFKVNFSCPGSNRRRLKNQTVMLWRDWLVEICILTCILTFAFPF